MYLFRILDSLFARVKILWLNIENLGKTIFTERASESKKVICNCAQIYFKNNPSRV